MSAVNLSLVSDILRRHRDGGVLSPPGCCTTFVEPPLPSERHRRSVPVSIVIEHRYAFALWLQVKADRVHGRTSQMPTADRNYRPPDLLTMDWHDDIGGNCDFIEDELRRLDQTDETEVGFFCWAGLRSLDDGHVAPAMWLNAVGDAYAVTKQRREERSRTITDRYGREHCVYYLRRPAAFPAIWERRTQGNGLLWDIDMDYFTRSKPIPDQPYTLMLSDADIAKELGASQEWLHRVLENLRGITIALEPKYTGGLTKSLHLFRQWEKACFAVPLFEEDCTWKRIVA